MCNITINRVQLVKEQTKRYDFDRNVDSSSKVVRVFNDVFHLNECDTEHCCAIFMDVKLNIVAVHEISSGTVDMSIVDVAGIFKIALLSGASRFIIAHNHPSGETEPSQQDISITKRLQKAGKIMSIEILDHIIIGVGSGWRSLAEEGYFD